MRGFCKALKVRVIQLEKKCLSYFLFSVSKGRRPPGWAPWTKAESPIPTCLIVGWVKVAGALGRERKQGGRSWCLGDGPALTWPAVVRLGWASDQKSHQSCPDQYRSVLGQKRNQYASLLPSQKQRSVGLFTFQPGSWLGILSGRGEIKRYVDGWQLGTWRCVWRERGHSHQGPGRGAGHDEETPEGWRWRDIRDN